MVNTVAIYQTILHGLMKLAGVRPQLVEIEPGTVVNFWVPTRPDNKPAVVLLHGFAVDGILTWQFQVPALTRKYSVYVPDFLFFGGSVTDSPRRSPEFQAECMAKGLRKLGVEQCTVVGLSYGGMVGFRMAELYPELVESMVVTNSVTALTESISEAALQRIGGFSSWSEYLLPTKVDGLKVMLEAATYKLPWLPDFFYNDVLESMFHHRKERVQLLEALVISDNDFVVPTHPKRVRFLCGENDRIFNEEVVNNMKEQLGEKATVELIKKGGHLVELERPFVYNTHLKQILASLLEHKSCKNNS